MSSERPRSTDRESLPDDALIAEIRRGKSAQALLIDPLHHASPREKRRHRLDQDVDQGRVAWGVLSERYAWCVDRFAGRRGLQRSAAASPPERAEGETERPADSGRGAPT